MRILNAGDKCTQLDLNSKLIGDLFLIIKCFFHSLRKGRQVFKTENNRSSNTYLYFNSYYTESYQSLHIKKIQRKRINL